MFMITAPDGTEVDADSPSQETYNRMMAKYHIDTGENRMSPAKSKTFVCGKIVFRRVQRNGPVWPSWEILGSWGWQGITKEALRAQLRAAK